MDQNIANSQSLISLHDIDNSMWKRSQLSSYFQNNTQNKVVPMNIGEQYESSNLDGMGYSSVKSFNGGMGHSNVSDVMIKTRGKGGNVNKGGDEEM